jgi:diguanylate cyclase (GGDEF)-like protein/PAS domain S-box-containing protein
MLTADDTEIAWLTRNKTATRFIALSAILLFASYGVVDWMLEPDMLGTTLLWRVVGVLPCLAIYFLMDRDPWLPRIPNLLAAGCVVVTIVISIIFLYLLHTPTIALAGHMQVLISISMFATVRTAIRATVVAMLVSFNLGLWWLGEPAQSFLLHNFYLLGGAFAVLVISEVSYRASRSRFGLEAKLQQQANIVQGSDDAIVGRAPDGRVTSWNPGAEKMFGYTATEMIGSCLQPLFSPDRALEEQRNLQQVLSKGVVLQFDTVRFCRNGERKELSVSASPIRDTGGIVIGVSEIARDITEKNHHARVLHDKEARFRAAIETTPDGFWAVDNNGRIIDSNLAYSRLSGYSRTELLEMRILDLEAREDAETNAQHIEQVMRDGSATFETQHRRKDGSIWPVEIITTFSPILGGQFYAFLRDLTERKKAEAMTWHQANFDHLTNLPNRALLFDRLNQECILATRSNSKVALLFADLDGFKQVNDDHGHQAGDQVLKEVARRWLETVRASDTVARLGGDEFAIVMSGVQDMRDISALADKLLAALASPIELNSGQTSQVGASIGIAVFPADAIDLDILISRADSAMYESKRKGKNTFSFKSP